MDIERKENERGKKRRQQEGERKIVGLCRNERKGVKMKEWERKKESAL